MALIDEIDKRETKFRNTLRDSSGNLFSIVETTDIGNGVRIFRLESNDPSYYYITKAKKKQICVHFTVGSIAGDIATLTKPGNKVSVHYVIDRQGNIYNLIPLDAEKNWSYHLGANCIGTNSVMSKSAIGIEVSTYGPLNRHKDGFYNAYGQLYCTDPADVENIEFRGYMHYVPMTEQQKDALYELVNWLCDKCGIPHDYKLDGMFENDKHAQGFSGIFTHAQVRKDKYDFPPDQVRFLEERWHESLLPPPKEEIPEEPRKEETIAFTEVRQKEPVQQERPVQAQPAKKSWLAELFDAIVALFAKSGK